ncbi:hypothetical protein [Thermoflexus hugenholtzii]
MEEQAVLEDAARRLAEDRDFQEARTLEAPDPPGPAPAPGSADVLAGGGSVLAGAGPDGTGPL